MGMIWCKDLTFIRKILKKSYSEWPILRQFTIKNLFLKARYLRKKTLIKRIKKQKDINANHSYAAPCIYQVFVFYML